ncbi:Putative NAD(P)-binding protein [Paraburkholderia tropica]|uniref:NAD-dependent epimerase/dehydratase family protein n=1 Tax=Paraburkholderia tropica TaxID=92647 RepID=UPI001CAC57A6|nr:NAD-dependent epimerase/dehydratase family protein [Paraburkholderia tropica]CAG9233175.1 Putative NAD(P)-binding protein [Paraburkholderia tropica]
MKVLIYGATGMVGQGVLRECLRAADVEQVRVVGRRETGVRDPKLRETVLADLANPDVNRAVEAELTGYDACFFCLGVSSVGMSEAEYARVSYDLTMSVAGTLARLNPAMTFVYVSGAGTDSSEHGRSMWARVKGRTENALQRAGFRAVYLFRPGAIEPLDGIRSKTRLYHALYVLMKPLWPLLRVALGDKLVTTADMGQAMLAVARHGAPHAVLEARDIGAAARG